jgi:putative ABC transport system ATP-binding protein
MIKAEGLSKTYRLSNRNRLAALRHVDIHILRGQFVIIEGPSGSGKTTLLSLLGFLSRPSAGRLHFCGEDITEFSDEELCRIRRRHFGFVFQEFHLLPRMTAWENVSMSLLPLGIREKERLRRASMLLDQLGVHERIYQRPEEMSGGEQQRVCIARALINEPEIVLADEPTSNIDEASAVKVLGALSALRAKGCTIVVATHDAELFRRAFAAAHLSGLDVAYSLSGGMIERELGWERKYTGEEMGNS